MGVDIFAMVEHHITDDQLMRMAQWERVDTTIKRATLTWIGHIARMDKARQPKIALFGWVDGKTHKDHAGRLQTRWMEQVLREAHIPKLDWFRLAQSRKQWQTMVHNAYPK